MRGCSLAILPLLGRISFVDLHGHCHIYLNKCMWGLKGFAELVLLSWEQFLSHRDQDVTTVLNTDAHLPGCDFEITAKGVRLIQVF